MDLARQISAGGDAVARALWTGTCVTLGTFDGVHLGHQELLTEVARRADATGFESVALVFRVPPRSVINPGLRTPLLCTFDERLELIRAAGVQHTIPIDFNDDVRSTTAEQFVGQLRANLGLCCLVLGEGAKIGNDQQTLSDLDASVGGDVTFASVPTAILDSAPVSSSGIRSALSEGDVVAARQMLGRPFHRVGRVVRGQGRATQLGIPTANIARMPDLAMPAHGIYATRTTLADGSVWRSATYIGDNPTLGGAPDSFETHLLGYDAATDLCGQEVTVSFVQYIRGDIRFSSVEELSAQLRDDIERIGDVLGGSEPPRTSILETVQ